MQAKLAAGDAPFLENTAFFTSVDRDHMHIENETLRVRSAAQQKAFSEKAEQAMFSQEDAGEEVRAAL